jgi:hypothetical protein
VILPFTLPFLALSFFPDRVDFSRWLAACDVNMQQYDANCGEREDDKENLFK